MAYPSVPWELEGSDPGAPFGAAAVSSDAEIAIERQDSGNRTDDINRAAGEAQSTGGKSGNLEERWKRAQYAAESYKAEEHTPNQKPQDDRQQQGGEEWDRVQDSIDHLKPGAPKVGSPGSETMLKEDAITGGIDGEDDLLWQSAMNKYQQDSVYSVSQYNQEPTLPKTSEENESNERWDAVDYVEDDYSPTHSRMRSQEQQSQEQQNIEYPGQTRGMHTMGGMEMDYEQQSSARAGAQTNGLTDDLSLWQTFKVLYTRNPMTKYYILGLLIVLVAIVAIIGVSISQKKESSNKECATASFTDKPFLLLPIESTQGRAGGFGSSISASSEYLVVGAPNSACDPQGSPCGNLFTIGGEAYLYRRNNRNEWVLHSSFILDDGVTYGDQFGQSVAISEDSKTVVIGAPKDDELGTVAGAIYVMEQPFASSTPPIRLVSDDIGFKDEFGGSVSVSATTLGSFLPIRVTNVVAGASFDYDFGSKSGSAYVFAKFDDKPPESACGADTDVEVGKWVQCQKLLPDDGEINDLFGAMVDTAGRTIVVGAMGDDDKGIDSGAAYVYYLDDLTLTWRFQEKLRPINFESRADRFGVSVATSGERIVVGADLDDSQGDDSGAAYVYHLSNGAWNLESKLIPAMGTGDHSGYNCGFRVDISNDGKMIVVGCPEAPGGGVAYIYNLQESGRWVQTDKLISPTGYFGTGLHLGGSVSLAPPPTTGEMGEMVIVGYGESNGEIFSYEKDC